MLGKNWKAKTGFTVAGLFSALMALFPELKDVFIALAGVAASFGAWGVRDAIGPSKKPD